MITNESQKEFLDFDYRDVRLLQRFTTESGKISPSRITKLPRKQQTALALAIKRARFLGLMPYIAK